jgi:hypothetical protein
MTRVMVRSCAIPSRIRRSDGTHVTNGQRGMTLVIHGQL